MTTPDLDVLAGLLAEATPGPWREGYGSSIICGGQGGLATDVLTAENGDDPDWPDAAIVVKAVDLALIVAAVNALPALIERVRAAEAVVAIDDVDGHMCVRVEAFVEARAAIGRVEALAARGTGTDLNPTRLVSDPAQDFWWVEYLGGLDNRWRDALRAALAPTPGAEQEGQG